ncbi:hypothetical protein HZH68_007983 [Vespula germanica]|uniref:Uncharacterized protein n=1 Tax=Vespula germanica TaxID=30212 RepID=A0A834K8P1_VESGE|nr:hypothetical protein HZH68_007983 [Vespula germanica]
MDVECSVNEPKRSVRIKRFYLDGDKDGRTPLEISASCSRSTDYEDAGRRDRTGGARRFSEGSMRNRLQRDLEAPQDSRICLANAETCHGYETSTFRVPFVRKMIHGS